jgi:hypothetical protein
MTTVPVLEKTATTFELPRTLGALVTVEPKQTAEQRLEAALANTAKLKRALDAPYAKRFQASLNPLTRYIHEHPKASGATLVALPIALVAGFSAWITGVGPAALVGLFPTGVVLAATYATLHQKTAAARADRSKPLTTADVAEAAGLLDNMTQSERAVVSGFVERELAMRVEAGVMTPAARERLDLSAAASTASESDKRTARVARFVGALEDDIKTDEAFPALEALLREHPPEERREIAGAMLERFFKDERCTLWRFQRGNDSDKLFRTLRTAQNAKEE